MMWSTVSIISLLSVLVTAQPEYDGTLYRVYPNNQRYFHQYANGTTEKQPGVAKMPAGDATLVPVVVAKTRPQDTPSKPASSKATQQSSFAQSLKKQIINQQPRKQVKQEVEAVAPAPALPAAQLEERKEIVIEYAMNSYRLTQNQKKKIASRYALYRQAALIRIDAYADMVGSAHYNKLLTDRRARDVKKIIVQLGIEENRIIVRGLGQTNVLPSGKNSRRSEIWVRFVEAQK